MPKTVGWIRKFHKPSSSSALPLLIFPHAGTGASAYRTFSKALSANFDVIIFQYPGRQDRAKEPMATSIGELAAGALAEFVTSEYNRDVPITVFGHSMGAMVGFEFVRQAEAAGVEVGLLGASGAVSPSRVVDMPSHPTRDEDLLNHLAALNGTGAAVLASRDVMKLALPALKADYQAFDAYECPPEVKVRTRIHVMGGSEDDYVTARELHGWAKHSEQDIEVTLFDGGHFYLNDNVDGIAELLESEVASAR